jgi:hypothetical protein
MSKRGNKINDIMKFVKGERAEKHYLKFLDENGNLIPDMPIKETANPFDVVIQFVDFSKQKNDPLPSRP